MEDNEKKILDKNLEINLKENTRLVAAVLHLKSASDLLLNIDNETGLILLETANAIISEYLLKLTEIDEIKNLELEISLNG